MDAEVNDAMAQRRIEGAMLIANNMKTAFMRHLTGVYGTDDLEAMSVDLNASTYNPQHKNARYCVRIKHSPYPIESSEKEYSDVGNWPESSEKDIVHVGNWLSPCINAIACFNTYLKNPLDIHAHIFYAAGYDFGKEWITARNNAAKYNHYQRKKLSIKSAEERAKNAKKDLVKNDWDSWQASPDSRLNGVKIQSASDFAEKMGGKYGAQKSTVKNWCTQWANITDRAQ